MPASAPFVAECIALFISSVVVSWAASNGLTGYHTHIHQGTQGYMGGDNHSQATGMATNPNVDTSGGSGGGGYSGGGGGY